MDAWTAQWSRWHDDPAWCADHAELWAARADRFRGDPRYPEGNAVTAAMAEGIARRLLDRAGRLLAGEDVAPVGVAVDPIRSTDRSRTIDTIDIERSST